MDNSNYNKKLYQAIDLIGQREQLRPKTIFIVKRVK